ncbi:hypothetical protein GALL_343360 [mine drainage metagenome]|uniref:Uncharacterized protein n=1 Tax=mine drainage metagenome TaxID=410659 RepID=A0A1J5QVH4_9ZZZZ
MADRCDADRLRAVVAGVHFEAHVAPRLELVEAAVDDRVAVEVQGTAVGGDDAAAAGCRVDFDDAAVRGHRVRLHVAAHFAREVLHAALDRVERVAQRDERILVRLVLRRRTVGDEFMARCGDVDAHAVVPPLVVVAVVTRDRDAAAVQVREHAVKVRDALAHLGVQRRAGLDVEVGDDRFDVHGGRPFRLPRSLDCAPRGGRAR